MSINVTADGRTATLSEQVAEEIRAWLGRRRMSQAQLARALKVSPMWVNYRLTGTQPIDLNDLDRIAAILEVDVIELFPRSDGRLTTTGGPQADHATRTNARSTPPTERPMLSGQRKRADARESTRRPARKVPFIPALMTDDAMAEFLDAQAA